jgi:hypothetical protein
VIKQSIRAGGHGGPPLRGGFVSINDHIGAVTDSAFHPSQSARTSATARCRVECRAGVPGAGHFSLRGMQASSYSAADRAGTIPDGQFRRRKTDSEKPPSRMVDPLSQQTVPTSPAEPTTQQEFRNIRRHRHIRDASIARASNP